YAKKASLSCSLPAQPVSASRASAGNTSQVSVRITDSQAKLHLFVQSAARHVPVAQLRRKLGEVPRIATTEARLEPGQEANDDGRVPIDTAELGFVEMLVNFTFGRG